MSSDEIQIMDYYYYGTDKYTTQENVILSQLPSEFEINFIIRPQGSGYSGNTGTLATEVTGGTLLIGNVSSANPRLYLYLSSSVQQSMAVNTGVENEVTWKYENGVHTLINGTNTISLTGYVPSNLKCSATSNCYIKNIRVKKL